MNFKRNLTPKQLALLASLLITFPLSFILFYLSSNYRIVLFSILAISVLIYFLFSFLLSSYLQRQIKLIYKLISQTKATKREEFYYNNILPLKTVDEVREDVKTWASQYKKEFEVLEKNEAFRKDFLQNLSHELKTPIFAIQGYLDTLLSGALENKEVNVKFLQHAARNVERLTSLVDDLDQISKLESGELQLNYSYFIIQDLIKEVYESLSLKASEKQILLTIRKDCEVPVTVYADKEKIRQVLVNLVDNAIKYGKQSGLVEGSVYKVEGKNVLIEITDNGFGIPEEHLPRIFERFYRTDQARSRKIGGSGLGLAICKHIIDAHFQKIHVRSTPEVGTTFGFPLPVAK